MKKLFIASFTILFISQICFSNSIGSGSVIFSGNIYLDSSHIECKMIKKKLKNIENKQILLESKINQVNNVNHIYGDLLTQQTGIFSMIVAITLFIVGYIIPKYNEKKYNNLLQSLKEENRSMKEDINSSIKFLDMHRLFNEGHNNNAILLGLENIKGLSEKKEYKEANRINSILVYIVKNMTKENMKQIKDFLNDKNFDYEKLLKSLKKSKFLDVYSDNLEKLSKL